MICTGCLEGTDEHRMVFELADLPAEAATAPELNLFWFLTTMAVNAGRVDEHARNITSIEVERDGRAYRVSAPFTSPHKFEVLDIPPEVQAK